MKGLKIFLAIIGAFIVIMMIVDRDSEISTSKEENDSVRLVQDSLIEVQLLEDSIKLIEAKKTVERLKAHFVVEKDEFNDMEYYTHKNWGKYWPKRKTLTAGVNSTGYAYLKSNYHADSWIFHTYVTILADTTKFSTIPVQTYEKNNRTDNNADGIYEVITYDDSEVYIEMLSRFSHRKIKVRFHGQQYYDDATLWKSDKKALAETWELAKAIKLMNK